MADLDELLAQRMAERDQLEASIQYAPAPVPISYENEQKQQQPISENFTYDASIPPPLPNSSNNLNIEYFIEFYDGKRMKIMADGELETYPPIIQFNNQFDNTLISYDSVRNKGIKFIIKVCDKEFSYNFDNQKFIMLSDDGQITNIVKSVPIPLVFGEEDNEESDDEPYCENNQMTKEMICPKNEKVLLFFTIEEFDEHRHLVFAYYNIEGTSQVIFRGGNFRMFNDDAFQYQKIKEIEKNIKHDPNTYKFRYNIYLKDKKREGATNVISLKADVDMSSSCPIINFVMDTETGLILSYDRVNDYDINFVIGYLNKEYMNYFEEFSIHEEKDDNDNMVKQIIYTIKDKKNENSSKLIFSLDEDNKMHFLNGIFKVENEEICKFMDTVHKSLIS